MKAATPAGPGSFRLVPAVAISEVSVPGMHAPRPRRNGRFSTNCGAVSVSANGETVAGSVAGSVATLDAGGPLKFKACGKHRQLGLIGGPNAIETSDGMMRIDHLRLSSKAPLAPVKPTPAGVTSPAVESDGWASVSFSGPGWLVHGESMSLGWHATCGPDRDHQRNLGTPRVIDGFASGWPVDPSCHVAHFTFEPQQTATSAYLASAGATGVFALVLAGSLLATRRRRLAGEADPIVPVPHDAPGSDPLAHARRGFAATAPVIAGAIAAGLFALRVGPPVALLALFLGLWGVNVRRLYTLAFAALALVPLGYLAQLPKNKNGGNFYYAIELIGEHWLATAAILLAGTGALLTALRIRWATHPRAGRWSLRRIRATIRLRRLRRKPSAR